MIRYTFTMMAISLALGLSAQARAQGPADFGHQWSTIGAPGNRSTIPSEVPLDPSAEIGDVAYSYRLTTTEVTVGQWFEFVQAYAPYSRWSLNEPGLLGNAIIHGNGPTDFQMAAGAANLPTLVGWRYAAIYCNWLCNGKANAAWAFESGAYDINTFITNPDGTTSEQLTRSSGAQFWIPSRSEWVKGGYYDPNRYGPGQGGYWQSPNGTNETLTSGAPGSGETNAGPLSPGLTPVGSYPNTQSPWGLLDISGGVSEWSETTPGNSDGLRFFLGSSANSQLYELTDHPEWLLGPAGTGQLVAGFRIASVVPTPATTLIVGAGAVAFFARRRECAKK